MTISAYWYDKQLKRYVSQFAAIFGDLKVMTGARTNRPAALIDVPIIIAPRDRVAVAAATGFTQNKPMRVPMMSVDLKTIDIALDRMKGTNTIMRDVVVPYGGTIQQDGMVVSNRMGVPYKLILDLSIYVSNKDQQFQILEQILPLFDPTLQIQQSDGFLDKTRITTVQLLHINDEETFPPGTNSSVMITTISFQVDAWLTVPATVHNNLVLKIIARVSAIDGNIADIQDIGAQFDADDIAGIVLSEAPEPFTP